LIRGRWLRVRAVERRCERGVFYEDARRDLQAKAIEAEADSSNR
jgi:hypothetical protein